MNKVGISLLMVFGMVMTGGAATPAYYWNFNNAFNPLASNIGGAHADVVHLSVGPGEVFLGAGTSLNALEPASPNFSLGAAAAPDIFQLESITFRNLDFRHLSNVQLSFAAQTWSVLDTAATFTVSYQIGTAAWSTPVSLATPSASWSVYQVGFGGVLDGKNDVKIRLTFIDAFDFFDYHGIDNVQIIPEPSGSALLFWGGLALIGGLLRSRAGRLATPFRAGS